jgi:hypothetical protein
MIGVCSKCRGPTHPTRRNYGAVAVGCRLCWLDRWTSMDVIYGDEEDRGYSAEGQSLSEVERESAAYDESPSQRDFCNRTDDTAATSHAIPHLYPWDMPWRPRPSTGLERWLMIASGERGDMDPVEHRRQLFAEQAAALRYTALMTRTSPTEDL